MIRRKQSEIYRARALLCEQHAKRTEDAFTRREWEDLAI
jgi:hypothetical protein